MNERRELTPEEARDRWLNKIKNDRRDASVSTYHYRLKLFVEWCEEEGIERMSQLSGWELGSYENYRRQKGVSPLTLNKEIGTLKNWLEFLARIEVVPEDLPEKVDPPDVPKDAESSDIMLHHEDASALLHHFRETPGLRGCRDHVLLELEWLTGARAGAIVALDVRDFHEEDGDYYVTFINRPNTDTPLKKGNDGERAVGLPQHLGEAIERYIDQYRFDLHCDHGRQPLLTSEAGRPTPGTIRNWTYQATEPCYHSACPHGHDRETCDYTEQSWASQCPSSRSPHQVRTGAITWMLHRGMPIEVIAARVNSSVETIEKHYDKPDLVEEMRKRRTAYLDLLSFDDEEAQS